MTEQVWTLRDALRWTTEFFERRDVLPARLNAERLLSAATGLSRVELYAYHDRPLSAEERAIYRSFIERRSAGEPLQYLTGEVPFRHIVLRVHPGVFIPRPETEVLVDAGLEALREAGLDAPVVVDLCTGSGAVAASVAHEIPGARVFATEIVPETAAAARANVERLGLSDRVTVLGGDLFAPLPAELLGGVDLVLSNPPYVPSADLPDLPEEVRAFEPLVALDGGPDGLDVARRIMAEAPRWLRPGRLLAMELDQSRTNGAAEVMAQWYEGIRVRRDLAGRDRIVEGRVSVPPTKAGQQT